MGRHAHCVAASTPIKKQVAPVCEDHSVSIFPIIVAAISLVFGVTVLGQWTRRRRPQQLLWGIALLMAAVAAAAYVGVLASGNELSFRLYYIFGALLNAAYLGMGSLYLALPRRVSDLILAALAVASALGLALMLVAPIDAAKLHAVQITGGAGTGVIKPGLWLVIFILHNIFAAVTVAGVALYSAYKVLRRQAPRRFAVANITIAVGVFVISLAGTSARLGASIFWVTQAVGFIILFGAFLLTVNLPALAARRNVADIPAGQGAAQV